MRIRKAASADVHGLASLFWWNASAAERAQQSVDALAADLDRWWARHAESHLAFVADTPRELVGMAWLALVARPPRPGASDRRSGDVQSVFVLPEHRGRGLGSALVRAAADHAHGLGVQRVTVHSGSRAVPVYERLGFASSPQLLMRSAT